jgi:hypothetical protein
VRRAVGAEGRLVYLQPALAALDDDRGVERSEHGLLEARAPAQLGDPEADMAEEPSAVLLAHEVVSRRIVTGPSLTRATCMCAPNTPVATGTPSARSASTYAS